MTNLHFWKKRTSGSTLQKTLCSWSCWLHKISCQRERPPAGCRTVLPALQLFHSWWRGISVITDPMGVVLSAFLKYECDLIFELFLNDDTRIGFKIFLVRSFFQSIVTTSALHIQIKSWVAYFVQWLFDVRRFRWNSYQDLLFHTGARGPTMKISNSEVNYSKEDSFFK